MAASSDGAFNRWSKEISREERETFLAPRRPNSPRVTDRVYQTCELTDIDHTAAAYFLRVNTIHIIEVKQMKFDWHLDLSFG